MKVTNLSFKYYKESSFNVVDNLSFEVEDGKITILVGRSGCGKSTLASLLSGSIPPESQKSGKVYIEGEDIYSLSVSKRVEKVTMMFQNADMQFCMSTLFDELIFCLENKQLRKEEIDVKIDEVCTLLNVHDLLYQAFYTLSGGEKQKCALACNLVLDSKVLILDEPFANVDPVQSLELITLLKKVNKEKKTTIFVIDHIMERWLKVVDSIYIMKDSSSIERTNITSKNIHLHKQFFVSNGIIYPDTRCKDKPRKQFTNPIIKMEKLTLKRNKQVFLEDTNVTIHQGEVVAIIGRSGCGKTTLLKSFFTKEKISGKFTVDIIPVLRRNYRKICKTIGFVMQNPANQFIQHNVYDEVAMSLNYYNNQDVESKTNQLLKEYGLYRFKKYSPYMLSQGQQRRLALLCVLCTRQKVLLLDEPTYGQDDDTCKIIMEHILNKVKEDNLTVIFTTHDNDIARKYSDTIYRMEDKQLQKVDDL